MQSSDSVSVVTLKERRSSPRPKRLGDAHSAYRAGQSATGYLDRDIPAVLRRLSPVEEKPLYELCKRGLDVGVALILLAVALPLFALVALLIKATSPGPVFFRQKRLGRGGTEFWCYKFRTMVVDAEKKLAESADLRRQYEAGYKIKNDPRITPIGSFLRKTSIDELPQFYNILLSDMSLIGPRPILRPELGKYGISADKLLAVKPGLSGLWQASGRSSTSYEERLRMDMTYIDTRCLWLDVKLLFRTALVVVKGSGAC